MILRPGDLRDFDVQPEYRRPLPDVSIPRLTSEWITAYDRMSAQEAKERCQNDQQFNALADELFERRNPRGGTQ
jgi:hypothetical protein